jgi:hypothetical protein
MTPVVAWSVLSGAGVLLALIMIGFRNWGGWLVFAVVNIAWMVYSAMHHASVVIHIFNLLMIAITVYFAYRWAKNAVSDEAPAELPVRQD